MVGSISNRSRRILSGDSTLPSLDGSNIEGRAVAGLGLPSVFSGMLWAIIFITMERKKPDKLNFAVALNNSDYFDPHPGVSPAPHPQNLNESLFFKYASSIIQVVAEDKLDSSCAGNSSQHPRNAIFEISEVKEFEGGGSGGAASSCWEQNNYNYMAAKMKKKVPNRKALAYNFSNITLLTHKINGIFHRPLKNTLETLRNCFTNSDYNKTKKEIKRASFYSGYTASTSNQQKTSKRNSKKLTEERRREMYEEGANSIKGWLEFKILLHSSHVFSSIKEFAAQRTVQPTLAISQVSTIKNEPMEKFYLTQYQHDNSISIARELPHNISGSLVYTADQNFEFTQKEVTLTTPEKFGSEDRMSTPPLPNHIRKTISNQQSFVEAYKPKDLLLPHAKPTVSKEIPIPTVSRPIKLAETEQRRYLTIRTNIYELPMMADHELRADRQRVIKDPSHLGDRLTRTEPETCETTDAILKQVKQACSLFRPKAKIQEVTVHDKEGDYSKLIDRRSYGSRVAEQKRNDVQIKKLVSSNAGQIVKQEKRDVQRVENYYCLNQNGSPKTSKAVPSSPTLHPDKKQHEPIKTVESVLKPSKPEKKNEKTVRIEESVVNEFTLDHKGKQALHPFSIKSQVRGEEKIQTYAYQPQNTERRDQRVKSRSKISIVMPQRKESPRVNVYHEQVRVDNKPVIQNSDRDRHLNNPYGYPTSNEKPKSPHFVHNQKNMQSPRQVSPMANQQFVYQLNQGATYLKQTPVPNTPQRILNHVKSNEQLKMQNQQQQQAKVEAIVRNSPGKVVSPTFLINSQERRMINTPSQFRQQDKKSFYSPQLAKDTYFLSPEKPNHQMQQTPKFQTPATVRRMYSEQEYFTKESNPTTQLRAINFNNNYYTSGPQSPRQPTIVQPIRNVFQQEEPTRRQTYMQRPPSSRQSGERVPLFANYSPLDSELESQQRSNHFSKNSSELSRPKSMNEKIFITLRKDK